MTTNSEGRQYFGTDGVRGMVGKDNISPDFFMKLGWAFGRVLADQNSHKGGPVLIGKDTRISGYMFESAIEAGLSAAGVDIRLLGPIPTPGVAFLTHNTRASAGIVISASHNLFHDNGIKFFAGDGSKLPDQMEHQIEKYLSEDISIVNPRHLGKARRITDAPRRYIEFCKNAVKPDLDLSGIRIVVDCANGATYHIAPKVFEELGADVVVCNNNPNGLNINKKCGATSPQMLQDRVLETRADVGVALDGDGDRLIMVDQKGEVVDGDEIVFIIALMQVASLRGVVGTQMSNLGLEEAIIQKDLKFIRSLVGDRYIFEALRNNQLVLGGESSGHIINLDLTTTGDGIISALQVLKAMLDSGKTLYELKSGMNKYPQALINVPIDKNIADHDLSTGSIGELIADIKNQLGKSGRVLLRRSGTEPLVRVMVEGEDRAQVEDYAETIAKEVRQLVL